MKTVICTRKDLHSGPLVLINAAHPLRTEPSQLTPVDEAGRILLERRAALLLRSCIQAVSGGGEIVPVSGWRSGAEQRQIWEQSLKEHGEAFTRSYVAAPDCSEHQTGLAIDLGRAAPEIDFIRPDFPDAGACGAFRRMAARYGFVERYAGDKQDLTGIAREPWHFRYVGAPHAQLLTENGLCLEEYAGFLRRSPRVCRLPGRREAEVFYVPCRGEQTPVDLPEACCQISGDNCGGFIVTVWRWAA